MEKIEHAICNILNSFLPDPIFKISDLQLENLKALCLLVDIEFFTDREINDWVTVKNEIESYLFKKGL